MRSLTASELLQVWENGLDQPILRSALQLLSTACSISDINIVARLSIGERDARLLQLREWMFGSRLINIAHCPKCSELIEWEMNTTDLRLQLPKPDTSPGIFQLEAEDYHIQFRLPNSEDLLKSSHSNVYQSNPQKVLFDCILEVKAGQKDCSAEELPTKVIETLNRQMANEDPQANITMALNCPACTHQWESLFDIVSYLWIEIDNWAKHLLQEVYVLARNFGWSERDIISMSAKRRQLYLEMLKI